MPNVVGVNVKMPPELAAKLRADAARNVRSLSGEVLFRLQQIYGGDLERETAATERSAA